MPETSTNDSLRLVNVQIDDLLTLGDDAPIDFDEHGSAPVTPPSGKVRLYAKSDGRFYLKDDAGNEVALDATTGGAVLKSLFDAYTLLAADSDDTPQAVALAAGELIGRKRSSGGIVALDSADLLDILSPSWSYPLRASTWYDGTVPGGGSGTGPALALTLDRLYAIPFWCPKETTWVKIGVNVFAAEAGKKFKLGIYDLGADGEPDSRLLSGAEQSLDATGAVEETISLELPAGLHFLAVRSDATGTAKLTTQDRKYFRPCGAAGLTTPGGIIYYSDTGTYAADGLPASFPSSPTLDTGTKTFRLMLKTGATP